MGEAKRRMEANGGILEPKGIAPLVRSKTIDLRVGVARDACAVAIQMGDILVHCTPEQARETARAFLVMADTVEALIAKRDRKILAP